MKAKNVLLCLLFSPLAVGAAPASIEDLQQLDISNLLDIEITSAARKPSFISKSASAVHVITAQDIQRSGASSIPELFRTVPGMQVAQISAHAWAVSIRGMNGRFANKLLVLIDGRTVYSPTFSGVYWDAQDVLMSEIERIEIIKGPGAALWGANAVNGVINIITKSAASSVGTHVQAQTDTENNSHLSFRYGAAVGEDTFWRLYGKTSQKDGMLLQETGARGADSSHQTRVGYKADIVTSRRDLSVHAEAYSGQSGDMAIQIKPSLGAPFYELAPMQQHIEGLFVLGRLQEKTSPDTTHTLQTVVDYSLRDWPLHMRDRQLTLDADYQVRTRFSRNDLVMGAATRWSQNNIQNAPVVQGVVPYAAFDRSNFRRSVLSVFAHNDFAVIPSVLTLTLGGKLEKHTAYKAQWMPTIKALLTPSAETSLWASRTKAVRAPGHLDDGSSLSVLIPEQSNAQYPFPYPLLNISGSFDQELLTAYELGWRQTISPRAQFDLALYRNEYSQLRSGYAASLPITVPPGYTPFSIGLANQTQAVTTGAEVLVNWLAGDSWSLEAGAAYHKSRFTNPDNFFQLDAAGSAPLWSGHLTTRWRISSANHLTATVRHVGRLQDINYKISLPAYTATDIHFSHTPNSRWGFTLSAVNLFAGKRVEGASEIRDTANVLVQPTLRAQINWKY